MAQLSTDSNLSHELTSNVPCKDDNRASNNFMHTFSSGSIIHNINKNNDALECLSDDDVMFLPRKNYNSKEDNKSDRSSLYPCSSNDLSNDDVIFISQNKIESINDNQSLVYPCNSNSISLSDDDVILVSQNINIKSTKDFKSDQSLKYSNGNLSDALSDDDVIFITASESSNTITCAVCLELITDHASLSSCDHIFCKDCIMTAANHFSVTNCPICRTPFNSIIHRKIEILKVIRPSYRINRNMHSNLRLSSTRHNRRVRISRRNVYVRRLHAQPIVQSNGLIRKKNISPEFFSENPAALHFLSPFIHRDLKLFLQSPQLKEVENQLREMFKFHHITSPAVEGYLFTYIGQFASHFLHELLNFASSPYDRKTYDRLVKFQL